FLLLCISRLNSGTDVASPELQKTMTITAAEYFDSFPDMGRKNAEVQLQEAIDRLWDRSIILKDDEKREEFRWIQYRAQYARGEGKAQITFSDAVMPYLTQLKGQFTRVVIKNISNLSRSYSIRIYEILQQFRSTGERIIALDDFKSSLMLDGKYKDFKTLNRDLIQPCVDELNKKSDLAVTVETIKKGRTVVALHFRFKEDKQIKMTI
ncbi:replication initiation protein, partial [Escherichia coli]